MNILVELAGEVTYWFKFYCVKKVSIWSYSGPYLSVFSPNSAKYEPEKLRIRTLFTQCFYPEKRNIS